MLIFSFFSRLIKSLLEIDMFGVKMSPATDGKGHHNEVAQKVVTTVNFQWKR